MDKVAHIIDPEGEVIIRLLNANEPFAVWSEEEEEDIEVVTSHHDALEPAMEVKINPEPPPRPIKTSWKPKKNKKISSKLNKNKRKKANPSPLLEPPAEPPSPAEGQLRKLSL